jgi:hypothetical protein
MEPTKSFGLYDDLSQDMYELAKERTEKELERRDAFNVVKNLELDQITVPGQKFCVVSWTGPNMKAKTSDYGMRIMGAFPSLKTASEHAMKVYGENNVYDTGVMEMNLWCFNYPVNEQVDQVDIDNVLNQFVIEHKREIEMSKQ